MKKDPKKIGLAIIGAGRVGLIRAELAARHPSVGWIGIAEINPERGEIVREKCGGDFVTTDYKELLARPEVNAVIVATDEHLHVAPVIMAAERKLPLLIEKPLATDLGESAQTLATGCCGMAGGFGFQDANFDLSMRIAEQDLFAKLDTHPDAIICAPGTSCRHQIADGLERNALHPIELVARAIADRVD